MRALCLGWPGDAKAVLIDDEYLWGESFLVAPVHEKDARSREVYLPAGDWWDYWSGARVAGAKSLTREVDLETMPLYVRAGAIVPMGPVRQHTGEVIEERLRCAFIPARTAASPGTTMMARATGMKRATSCVLNANGTTRSAH